MAIIESKGNGYALYNGVKLPSLPEHDKEKYPYAFIYYRNSQHYLVLSSVECFFGNHEYENKLTWAQDSNRAVQIWSYQPTAWGLIVDRADGYYSEDREYETLVWLNFDAEYLDYDFNEIEGLAKSDPISLDGMNVIEWDGDATGMELWNGNDTTYPCVSHATDIDVSKQVVSVNTYRAGGAPQIVNRVMVEKSGYFMVTNARYVQTASETYPVAGVYLYNSSSKYVSFFAYYPIEPAEPEQPEIDRGTLFLLYKIFSPDVFYAITGKKHWSE